MAIDERPLHGVQSAILPFQALDGDQLLAVKRRQKLDTRVDGAEPDVVARKLAEHDGAGAAVALGAAFLGTGPAEVLAQEIEHGTGRCHAIDAANLAVEHETNGIAMRGCSLPGCHDYLRSMSPAIGRG